MDSDRHSFPSQCILGVGRDDEYLRGFSSPSQILDG